MNPCILRYAFRYSPVLSISSESTIKSVTSGGQAKACPYVVSGLLLIALCSMLSCSLAVSKSISTESVPLPGDDRRPAEIEDSV